MEDMEVVIGSRIYILTKCLNFHGTEILHFRIRSRFSTYHFFESEKEFYDFEKSCIDSYVISLFNFKLIKNENKFQ